MNTANRRKLFLYSALFIALALNMTKLLALRKNGVVARFWHFDLGELLFQLLLTFLFCLSAFHYNKDRGRAFLEKWRTGRQGVYLLANCLLLMVFAGLGIVVQRLFFQQEPYLFGGYTLRFSFCIILITIELRIFFLMEDTRTKDMENEHLRNANLQTQLTLLKGQINPHFFFNALSSLSAIVREDSRKAQHYISHLSKVFRYSLQSSEHNLVTLKEELEAVRSYAQLLEMRYETGFTLTFPQEDTLPDTRIPPMSLQLLVENALKHNRVSAQETLRVEIALGIHQLEIRNNLQPTRHPEAGTGIGLANLNERYRLLLHQEIDIVRTETDFIVKLPLP
jgi:two-component system, LytTR family, sensor kinase